MEKIIFESVDEFLARGGKIKQCAPANAFNAQKPQMIKVRNSFSNGRKAFTIGSKPAGSQRRTVEMETK